MSAPYDGFLRSLTEAAVAALRAHAEAVLTRFGIDDEPLEWAPDVDARVEEGGAWIASADNEMTDRLLHGSRPLGDIAEQLGITLTQARMLLRLHPNRAQTTASTRHRPPLKDEDVHRLVVERNLTIRVAARALGVDRKALSKRCGELGIDLWTPERRRRWHLDPEWFREQYVDGHRTLPDLARELGCSPAQMARMARECGVQLRERGGRSHARLELVSGREATLLQRAAHGQGARQRLVRFIVVAESPSMNAAAKRLGIACPTVISQLGQLERAVGAPLVIRSNKRTAQSLTPEGRRLLREIRREFGDAMVSTPPQPLRSAFSILHAERKLTRLALLQQPETLREIARNAGTDPGSLAKSIWLFESQLGRRLTLAKLSWDSPVRLSAFANRLLAQWCDSLTRQ